MQVVGESCGDELVVATGASVEVDAVRVRGEPHDDAVLAKNGVDVLHERPAVLEAEETVDGLVRGDDLDVRGRVAEGGVEPRCFAGHVRPVCVIAPQRADEKYLDRVAPGRDRRRGMMWLRQHPQRILVKAELRLAIRLRSPVVVAKCAEPGEAKELVAQKFRAEVRLETTPRTTAEAVRIKIVTEHKSDRPLSARNESSERGEGLARCRRAR